MRTTVTKYDFDNTNLIGDGGFAYVYRAKNKQEKKEVALKILKPEFDNHPKVVENFFRDSQIARKLKHNNIINIFEIGNNVEKPYYFIMEYCPGGDLRQLIQSGKSLPIKQFINHSIQLCDALNYIHERGLLHRDIKASNVLFRNDVTPILTDFGSAADEIDIEKILKEKYNIGAPPYMSPEVWQSKNYDARSDLYSFGVLLYYGLTGRFPFSGRTPEEYKKLHIHNAPQSPSKERQEVNKELDKVILSLLEKEPDNRIPSAKELKKILEKISKNDFISDESLKKYSLVIFLEHSGQNGITVNEFPFCIGKKAEPEAGKKNHLVINNEDSTVSRFHAVIEKVGNSFVFKDRSTNGSFVNEEIIHQNWIHLRSDNKVLLGKKTKLIIKLVEKDIAEETTPVLNRLSFLKKHRKIVLALGVAAIVLSILLFIYILQNVLKT